MFWPNSKSKRKEINAENIISLYNYKPKLTASLFSVLSLFFLPGLPGSGAISLCCATAECGT